MFRLNLEYKDKHILSNLNRYIFGEMKFYKHYDILTKICIPFVDFYSLYSYLNITIEVL